MALAGQEKRRRRRRRMLALVWRPIAETNARNRDLASVQSERERKRDPDPPNGMAAHALGC